MPEQSDPGTQDQKYATALSRVVGIGSSAGGLEALQIVLRHLPIGQKVSYLIAQHVSPHHRSLMAELLDKETSLAVLPAVDGAQILPDHVYVTPPNADITISGDRIRLSTPLEGHGPRPSVDGMFLSLASQWGSSAVAVLLSGTGDDGTYGMREVHAAGGLTIAQDPESAKYPAMPAAAIRAGVTDLVLAPELIGPSVTTVLEPQSDMGTALPAPFLQRVMELLRSNGAGDFTHYKSGTLLRQIARRMAVLQLDDQADYLTYLASNPVEARLLRQSILVCVTSFMRDPAAWDQLASLLRDRWQEAAPDRQFRVWVPGCATGEEAYTLAMVIDDILGHPPDLSRRLKIFATDLDEVSLDYARRATYPAQAISALPPEWQARYFNRRSSMVEVSPALRDATIFARHDIGNDPAFVRLDLVSFRNVLIYFDNSLQSRVLRALHYSLRPEAMLFLGASEGVATMHEWFVPLSAKYRIYERVAGVGPLPLGKQKAAERVPSPTTHPPLHDRSSLTREALVKALLPSAVLVDETERIVEIIGDATEFLVLPTGRFDDRLSALVREDLRVEVRGLVVQARASAQMAETTVARQGRAIGLRAIPLVSTAGVHVAVAFDYTDLLEQEQHPRPIEVQRLQRELAGTREALQATIEELETSNEELQATNEEMTASAEELQASNEELETINEELQATNEELGSLNQELQVRQHELTLANEDLSNIQDALSHALVIVDLEMRITRFSPLAVRVFALVESDLGRPLTSVPTTVNTDHLEAAIKEVILTGERTTAQLSGDGHTYMVHVVPYRTSDGSVKGAILSISDLTHASPSGDDASLALRAMTEGLDEVVWRRDANGQVTFVNHAVFDIFGLTPDQVMSDPLAMDYAIEAEDLAAFGSLSASARPRYLRYTVTAHGERTEVEDFVHASVASAEGGQSTVGSIRRSRPHSTNTPDMDSAVSALLELPNHAVLLLNRSGAITAAGTSSAELLGVAAAELEGRHALGLIHEQDVGTVTRALTEASSALDIAVSDADAPMRVRIVRRGGSIRWVDLLIRRLPDSGPAHHMMLLSDVTGEHDRALDMGRRLMFDGTTGLLNRGAFIDALRVELIRQAPHGGITGVLWLDLDGFKGINDHYGHSIGDIVLLEVAERLQASCRRQDRVGRLGGDEFGVVITDCDQIDIVETTAARIIDAMAAPMDVPGGSVTVGISVGASLAPHDAQAAENLLNAADAAMYLAKRGGGNRIQYYKEGLNEEAASRALLRQHLAEAIRMRAFRVAYQPILDAVDGSIWGLEALVRWQRGDESVSAGEFISTAERTGQIRVIGRQVVDAVFRDLPTLVRMVPEVTVCVNLSVSELEDPHVITSFLREAPRGLLANLAVEVTESALVGEDSQAVSAIETLRSSGVDILLDDFGTGYANFAALDRVTPEVIKADRSFLDRAVSGVPRARSLLSAAVALSDAVGARSLAEGVSSAEHQAIAREIGVDLMQGFHLGMPMPLEEIADYAASRPR
jgi:two-component system CheB/CheR fusion protein